jgi:hypothetical protein
MKDKAGHSGTKAGHVPNCPSDKAGQDGTSLLKDVRVSRLSRKLASIHCIDELYGFANRRKVLGIYDDSIIPKWTDEEVALIVERKFELQKLAAKGKRK